MFDFDPSACSTHVLEHTTAVRGILIDHWLEGLRVLGRVSDLALIFPSGCYLHPDWDFVDACGEDAVIIVREIVRLAHDVARADEVLELRKRLN
jgi:hypothetical protein